MILCNSVGCYKRIRDKIMEENIEMNCEKYCLDIHMLNTTLSFSFSTRPLPYILQKSTDIKKRWGRLEKTRSQYLNDRLRYSHF